MNLAVTGDGKAIFIYLNPNKSILLYYSAILSKGSLLI